MSFMDLLISPELWNAIFGGANVLLAFLKYREERCSRNSSDAKKH